MNKKISFTKSQSNRNLRAYNKPIAKLEIIRAEKLKTGSYNVTMGGSGNGINFYFTVRIKKDGTITKAQGHITNSEISILDNNITISTGLNIRIEGIINNEMIKALLAGYLLENNKVL